MAHPPEDDSFLSRWSRRKAEARVEEAPPAPPAEVVEPLPPAAPATLTDEELAALPKIEDLVSGDDIRAFLRPGVPNTLKNAALQKMWLLTPAIRDYRDPAVDYAWDWNTPGGVPGDGAAPSPERALQMMRDLFAPRPPVEDRAETDVSQPDPVVPDATKIGETDQIGPLADEQIKEIEYDKSLLFQSDTEGPIVRRRHGGALPS